MTKSDAMPTSMSIPELPEKNVSAQQIEDLEKGLLEELQNEKIKLEKFSLRRDAVEDAVTSINADTLAITITSSIDTASYSSSSSAITTANSSKTDAPAYRAEPGRTLTIYGADGRRHTYDDQGRELGNDPLTGVYEEVEIEDMEYDEPTRSYAYPCPCGDIFRITVDQLIDGEEIATCPSCSLIIRIIYDPEEFFEPEEDSEDDD